MNPKPQARQHTSPVCFLHEFEEPDQIMSTLNIQIKRIYAKSLSKDGYRVLVDRLWPRGVSRERASRQRVTLLYAARDPQINHAVLIEEAITKGLK